MLPNQISEPYVKWHYFRSHLRSSCGSHVGIINNGTELKLALCHILERYDIHIQVGWLVSWLVTH